LECFYREQPGAAPVLSGTARRSAGTLSFDPARGAVHRIANEGRDRAISLHVYGAGADRIATGINRILG
jgi:predicted metal-dependent enzyme (double-stranded beta helix superfamily)